MMGIKQKESKLFYNFSLSSRIPKDHFLRKVEGAVDFNFVYKLAKPYYSSVGQPGIDPVVLLKMMLIGYFYDITSERKLAQELSVNLAFMYFLGYDIDEPTPNHSVLSKARKRFGAKLFEQFFEHVVEQCKFNGLIQADKAFMDSSLITADASMASIIDCDQKVILKRTPKQYLKIVEETNPSDDLEDCDTNDPGKTPSKLPKNKRSFSTTDPDASLIKHKYGPTKLAYKQHLSVDGGPARVITACAMTSANVADEHMLPHLISKAHEKHDILPDEVGADTKYGTADNYRFLLECGIKPSIPHHAGTNTKGLWAKDKFIYDKEKDHYTCPAGQILKKNGFDKKQRKFIYRSSPRYCNRCKHRKACTASPAGRSVTRHVHEASLEKAKEHLETYRAKSTIRERGGAIEPVFACEKKDLGLQRAKFRGLPGVSIQSLLTATAYNVKKLVKYGWDCKQRLKLAMSPSILPDLKQKTMVIGQKVQESRAIAAASLVKKLRFSFFQLVPVVNGI